jgi:glycogen operon protein
MTRRDWGAADGRTLGVFLNGDELAETTPDGRQIEDDSFLLLFNAHFEDVKMRLPNQSYGREWELEVSTASPELEAGAELFAARAPVAVKARSLVLLRRRRKSGPRAGSAA